MGNSLSRILSAFREHEASIRRIIGRYRSRPEDIEDLAQDTFLKSFAAELKQDIVNPKAFLFRLAKNVAINDAYLKVNSATDSIEAIDCEDVLKDNKQPGIEQEQSDKQELHALSLALAELPDELREALTMRKIDGLKFKQIATRLNVSVSTAEKRVAKALIQCNKLLKNNNYHLPGNATKGRAQRDTGALKTTVIKGESD